MKRTRDSYVVRTKRRSSRKKVIEYFFDPLAFIHLIILVLNPVLAIRLLILYVILAIAAQSIIKVKDRLEFRIKNY